MLRLPVAMDALVRVQCWLACEFVSRKYVSDWNWRNYFVPVLKENHVLEDHGKDGIGYVGDMGYRGACAIVRNCDLTLPNRPPPPVNL